jgi:hypothetical protein
LGFQAENVKKCSVVHFSLQWGEMLAKNEEHIAAKGSKALDFFQVFRLSLHPARLRRDPDLLM